MSAGERVIQLKRRNFLIAGLLGVAASAGVIHWVIGQKHGLRESPQLPEWIRNDFLKRTLYRIRVNPSEDHNGPTGANVAGFKWIEEQREGASWITRGMVNHQPLWIDRGWRQLDWGLEQQDEDGGFTCDDVFHSTTFFMEALARACIVDSNSALPRRVDALNRMGRWLMRPDMIEQAPVSTRLFAHRHFILAAGFGQVAEVTKEIDFLYEAHRHAEAGIARQWADGTNPERDGFDAGYQMIGVVMALRYLSILADGEHRDAVVRFITASIDRELRQIGPDGNVDTSGSTRLEQEIGRGGVIKLPPYEEIFESLMYGSDAMWRSDWFAEAEKIAALRNWIEK